MEKISNIAKNTSYFTIALVLQKVITFSYFTILAWFFIPEDLGKYYFAISFTSIFSIFIDLGLNSVLTREVAKGKDEEETDLTNEEKNLFQKNNTQSLLSSVMAIKIPLAVLSTLLVIFLVNVMHYPPITKQLVYLSSVCMVLDSFTLAFFSTIRGFHNLKFESISSIIYQLISMGFGILFLKLGFGLKMQMFTSAMASIYNVTFSAYIIINKFKLSLKPKLDWLMMRPIILITIPFALYGILQKFYTYFDSVLLSFLAGDRYVGLYQVAFKIINALQFLPMAFSASLYPALSLYWAKNRSQLSITFERSMNYLIIISLPISVGIISLADKIILLFSSNYADAVLPLQINIAALLFIFISFPIGALLNACDRQKINTINMAITLISSIILNILLIPKFHAVGASITVVITNLIMFLLGIYQVPKITKYNLKNILLIFLKTSVSVIFMAITAIYLKNYLNIFTVVAISGLFYLLVLYMLKGFRKEDIFSIMQSFKKS
jgi:O-antigen/teichoic acid export membrane protein